MKCKVMLYHVSTDTNRKMNKAPTLDYFIGYKTN